MGQLAIFKKNNLTLIEQIQECLRAEKYYKEQGQILRNKMLEAMQNSDIKSFESAELSAMVIDGTESISLDTTKLKKEDPLMYEQLVELYPKTTKRKAYVKMAVSNESEKK